MGVFAITQGDVGERIAGEPSGDGRVIGREAGEDFLGQSAAVIEGDVALALQGFEEGGVVGGIAQGDDIAMVFRGGAEHGGAADINGFDVGGLLEGIEIDDDQINAGNAELGADGGVVGIGAPLEDAAMHLGVEGLDPPAKNFWELGDGGDILDGDAGLAQGRGGAAGGQEGDAEVGQAAGQGDQTGFVGNAEQRALNLHEGGLCHRPLQNEKIIALRVEGQRTPAAGA